MKDNFSALARQYALYLPTYPSALYDYLATVSREHKRAWDCGTGNGQVAQDLASYFEQVYATDISEQQLAGAIPHPKITYSLQPAEQTNFPSAFFDLITVAQAIHWFAFDRFYAEVKRTLKPGGIIAVIGYSNITIDSVLDPIITDFYSNIVGPFWDQERRYIDERYMTIPFPFKELSGPSFEQAIEWSFEHLIGYLGTWSAVKHFKDRKGYDPVTEIYDVLKEKWSSGTTKLVRFPILLRVGQLV